MACPQAHAAQQLHSLFAHIFVGRVEQQGPCNARVLQSRRAASSWPTYRPVAPPPKLKIPNTGMMQTTCAKQAFAAVLNFVKFRHAQQSGRIEELRPL